MPLMHGDLRTLIDKGGSLRFGGDFQNIYIMREIAIGIRELHSCGRIHKDIKASNILVGRTVLTFYLKFTGDVFQVKIGDYENSDDVVGTGFWRAPEVLRAVRDGSSDLRLVCSPAVDVYGFGMVRCATRSLRARFLSKAILSLTTIWFCRARDRTFLAMWTPT
jgi:serine/threonine protein kinase